MIKCIGKWLLTTRLFWQNIVTFEYYTYVLYLRRQYGGNLVNILFSCHESLRLFTILMGFRWNTNQLLLLKLNNAVGQVRIYWCREYLRCIASLRYPYLIVMETPYGHFVDEIMYDYFHNDQFSFWSLLKWLTQGQIALLQTHSLLDATEMVKLFSCVVRSKRGKEGGGVVITIGARDFSRENIYILLIEMNERFWE